MTQDEAKQQWKICPWCGQKKVPNPEIIKRAESIGMTQDEAEKYVEGNAYFICENPVHEQEMLPMGVLEHGAYYHGDCRNATIARWNAETQRFVYIRTKFGNVFPEDIEYWVEGHPLDEFKPYGKIENPPFEIPMEA